MEDKDIDVIRKVTESMDKTLNNTLRDVIDQYGTEITMNIMINVSTAMLAKALILTPPSAREVVQDLAFSATLHRVEEGHAAVESILAIQKAKG